MDLAVWTDGQMVGRAQTAVLAIVCLKDSSHFPHQKPIETGGQRGPDAHYQGLKEQGSWLNAPTPIIFLSWGSGRSPTVEAGSGPLTD